MNFIDYDVRIRSHLPLFTMTAKDISYFICYPDCARALRATKGPSNEPVYEGATVAIDKSYVYKTLQSCAG